jgi:hypothetical protein
MKKLLLIVFAMCFITAQAQKHPRFDNTKKEIGIVMTVSGVALTGAAILEGGSQYGTYVNVTAPNGAILSKYVTPPIWEQTPRNLMLVVGVGFTITGLFTLISNR